MTDRVYKFMSGEQYHLDSLARNQVYFSSFDELNDPYEGLLHYSQQGLTDVLRKIALTHQLRPDHSSLKNARREMERMYKGFGRKQFSQRVDAIHQRTFDDFLELHRTTRNVLSLSKAFSNDIYPSPLNSMMMWGHYANGMKGLCVEFDFVALHKSIAKLNGVDLTSRPVTYSKVDLPVVRASTVLNDFIYDTSNTSTEIQDAFATKHSSWDYENEVRLMGEKHGLNDIDERCIKRVFVAKSNPQLMNQIIDILRQKSHQPQMIEVVTQPQKYGVGFAPVDY
ncbi:DUF2971 domain-containing protein [Vibrio sp. WXL103]|uniref:DUF2971 domain-containing protein n=1 Tax=Vibrio sp. WXL103 TaxID=3450710 RepID=UPI003EC76714